MTDSPDMLDTRRGRGEGVRRLNRVPMAIAAAMLLLILGAVTYTYQLRLAEMRRHAAENDVKPEPASASGLLQDAPDGGFIPAKEKPQPAAPPQPQVQHPAEKHAGGSEPDPRAVAWERYWREEERLQQARSGAMQQALHAPSLIGRGSAPKPSQPPAPTTAEASPVAGQLTALYTAEAARQRRLAASDGSEEKDLNRAAEKRGFLADRTPQGREANTLAGGREAPASPYEIKAGTIIPAIMIGGVNSDLPGQILGQVTQNVYDSATGRFILIPQGAKLIGAYDNAVLVTIPETEASSVFGETALPPSGHRGLTACGVVARMNMSASQICGSRAWHNFCGWPSLHSLKSLNRTRAGSDPAAEGNGPCLALPCPCVTS